MTRTAGATGATGLPQSDPSAPPAARPIRIALVDDHNLVREGVRLVLAAQPGLDVVGEAADGADAFALVGERRPDVLLLDITLSDTDGIPLIRALRTRFQDTAIIVLTMHRDAETVRQALLAGAAGYVVKGARANELVDAVRAVARGERYLHSSITGVVVDDSLRWLKAGTALSVREREILGLLGGGSSPSAISLSLGISPHTVRRHIANLAAKLDIHGISSLVAYARRHGLVRQRDEG